MSISHFELSLGLVTYLKTLTPREQWKLCRMILLKLDTRHMTRH
jgi:hypothetical protein